MSDTDLLDPKIDVIFKRQFAENKALLIDLINAIRSTEPPVVDLQVINPEITPEEIKGKLVRLDILAQDETGLMFDIEMQTNKHIGWAARSVFYLARMLGRRLKKGENYHQVRPVVGIHLVDFDLFPEVVQACWMFELRDRLRPDVVLDRSLQLNVVELPKADRLRPRIGPVLAQWITYFKHWNEENLMQQLQHPPVKKAYQGLRALSAEDKAWYQALAREMAEYDAATLRAEQEDAQARGLTVAQLRSQIDAHVSLLRRQLRAKFGKTAATSVDVELRSAQLAQLEYWADRILFAETVEQVFSHH